MEKAQWILDAIEALVAGYGLDTAKAVWIAEKLYERDHTKHEDGAYAVFLHLDGDEPPFA